MAKKNELPGFRFHPTDEELLNFYLKNMVHGKKSCIEVIGFLNIYHYDPWDLPGLSKIGEREWYFFVPRDRKHGTGGRPSRTTAKGYWKATGSDRKIVSLSEPKRVIGLRKTLVYYQGRAPGGIKTDWVMNEYRLPDNCPLPKDDLIALVPMAQVPQVVAMEEENDILIHDGHTEIVENQERYRATEIKGPSSSLKLPFGSLQELNRHFCTTSSVPLSLSSAEHPLALRSSSEFRPMSRLSLTTAT